MFKKLGLKILKSKFIKGHMTWLGVATMLAPLVSQYLGYDAGPDLVNVAHGIGSVMVLVGKARAVYQAQQGL